MITRICISINNRCNLKCTYCHFREKHKALQQQDMNVFHILDNVRAYIEENHIEQFKIGFVGNGEPLLDFPLLKKYLLYIQDLLDDGTISAYTITNGTVLTEEMLLFFRELHVSVGFSLDGIQDVHDPLRCNTFDTVMRNVEMYHSIYGTYPPFNCTIGKEVLVHAEETIQFFQQFDSRITFSRMIGTHGISLKKFHQFLEQAEQTLNVRRGSYDCTMYGGKCAAGIDNLFFANGKVYICGNCVDLDSSTSADTPIRDIHFDVPEFDRNYCYKEESQK